MGPERERDSRLCAVVRADICDSTSTLSVEGIGAALLERQRLVQIVDGERSQTGGALVGTEGDAVVASWPSAARALVAAQAIAVASHDESFSVRIGVSIGELTSGPTPLSDTSATGIRDQVTTVEGQAPAGRVAVDERVRGALRGHTSVTFDPIGARSDVGSRDQIYRASSTAEFSVDTDSALKACMFTAFTGATRDITMLADLASDLIHASGGEVIDMNGPGQVALFDSCCTALSVAEGVHQYAAALNLRGSTTTTAAASIAIAVGEVTSTLDDRFGTPLVEAARLLAYGQGATAITQDTREIAGATQPKSEGENVTVVLKGFDEPTAIHRLGSTPASPYLPLPASLTRAHRFGFVGRSDDLAVLKATWKQCIVGVSSGMVISGEEGSGKTRLASELALHAFADGGVVLLGACDEELRSPYGPVAQALRPAAMTDSIVEAAVNRGEGDLGPLFETRSTTAPDLGSVDRVDFFHAISSALGRVSEHRPVLLVLDDVQWATPDTIQVVEHLLSDAGQRRLMVLATCRVENLDIAHPVRVLLATTRTLHRVRNLRLDRLQVSDISALLETQKGEPLTDTERHFARQLTTVSGGSPLFVEELLAHLNAAGVLVYDAGWKLTADLDEVPIPDSIIGLMSHRLARLGPQATAVLAVAATIGSSFEAELVSAVAGVSIDIVMDLMDAATESRVLGQDEETGECYFGDELTREAARRTLQPSRRARLHRSIAEKLELNERAPIDSLAYHWDKASGSDAQRKAVAYLLLAARRDMSATAWDSAIERLDRISTLLDQARATSDHARGDVHYLRGASLRMIGDASHRPDLMEAAACARRVGDADLLANSALAMMRPGAWYSEAGVVDDDIISMCEDALALLDEAAPTRVRVLAALATNLAYHSDGERRWNLIREAQQLAAQLNDPSLIGAAGAAELIACQEPDLFERRFELAHEVQRIGRAIGDRHLAFTGGFFIVLEHVARGEIGTAERLSRIVLELAEQSGTYWQQFLTSQFTSLLVVARCQPNAHELIDAERDAFEQHPVDSAGVHTVQTGALAMARGTMSDMLLPIAEAIEEFSEYPDWVKKWNFAIAKALLDAGESERALAVIAAHPKPDFDRYWLPSMHLLGVLGLTLGRRDFCQQVLIDLTPYRGRLAIIGVGAGMAGQVSTALGQAALGLDELGHAETLFREASQQASTIGFPFFEATALRLLATTLLRQDPRSIEAGQILDKLDAMCLRHDFALEASEAKALRSEYTIDRS